MVDEQAGAGGNGDIAGAGGGSLTGALESTLGNLTESIGRMESIVRRLEAGEADWEESIRLLTEANELAMESSRRLERAVQDIVYGSEEEDGSQSGEESQVESRDSRE